MVRGHDLTKTGNCGVIGYELFQQAVAHCKYSSASDAVGRRQDSRHLAATSCQFQLVVGFVGEIRDERLSQLHGDRHADRASGN